MGKRKRNIIIACFVAGMMIVLIASVLLFRYMFTPIIDVTQLMKMSKIQADTAHGLPTPIDGSVPFSYMYEKPCKFYLSFDTDQKVTRIVITDDFEEKSLLKFNFSFDNWDEWLKRFGLKELPDPDENTANMVVWNNYNGYTIKLMRPMWSIADGKIFSLTVIKDNGEHLDQSEKEALTR